MTLTSQAAAFFDAQLSPTLLSDVSVQCLLDLFREKRLFEWLQLLVDLASDVSVQVFAAL